MKAKPDKKNYNPLQSLYSTLPPTNPAVLTVFITPSGQRHELDATPEMVTIYRKLGWKVCPKEDFDNE